MRASVRDFLHAYLPANFHDPFGLAMRLIRSRDPAALLAMGSTAMGAALTPLDMMLEALERRALESAPPPRHPLILVCGPPRSGTTVVAQTLIRNLDLGYLNNLTAVFPRSPITANRLFGRLIGFRDVEYRSFYGKSEHLSGPNDALYIWDRWFGADRTHPPSSLEAAARREMPRFFAAYEQLEGGPLLNKNNSLNTCAALVGEVLPQARFLCMTRDPVFLAQALLVARQEIQGDESIPYGIHPPHRAPDDPVEDVCRQVIYFERMAAMQQASLGSDRFWVVPYERFCEEPVRLVREVSERILGRPLRRDRIDPELKPFPASRKVKVAPEVFARIEATLERLRAGAPVPAVVAGVYA